MTDVVGTVNAIDTQTLRYAPAVLAGNAKKQAVLDGILAGAKAGENVPIPQVQAIAGMIDMFVSIFNALGVFKKKTA